MFRYRLLTVGLIILAFLLIGALNPEIGWVRTAFGEYQTSSLIRLHVIANSDSPTDQALKLRVRDAIIKATEPLLLKVKDPDLAGEILLKNKSLLERVAIAELNRNNRPLPVKVVMGRFGFPERSYPFGVLPAGEYRAIRVILGQGEGKNWWCVLYPPLCLLAPNAPGWRQPQKGQPKVEYHFKVLESWVKAKGLSMDPFWQSWGRYFGLH